MIIIIEPLSDRWQPTIQPHEPATELSVFLIFLTASEIWFFCHCTAHCLCRRELFTLSCTSTGHVDGEIAMCKKCMAICVRKLPYLIIPLGTTRWNYFICRSVPTPLDVLVLTFMAWSSRQVIIHLMMLCMGANNSFDDWPLINLLIQKRWTSLLIYFPFYV